MIILFFLFSYLGLFHFLFDFLNIYDQASFLNYDSYQAVWLKVGILTFISTIFYMIMMSFFSISQEIKFLFFKALIPMVFACALFSFVKDEFSIHQAMMAIMGSVFFTFFLLRFYIFIYIKNLSRQSKNSDLLEGKLREKILKKNMSATNSR